MKTTNSLITKYLKMCKGIAWRLKNMRVTLAAPIDKVMLAIELCSLYVEMVYSDKHSSYGRQFPTAKRDRYESILAEHSISVIEGENPGITMYNDAFEPLADIMEREGDKVELFGDSHKDKFRTILEYYTEYSWLKDNHLDIPDGTETFEAFTEKIRDAFQEVGVAGRFKWNIK